MSFAGNTLDLIRTVINRRNLAPVGPSYFDAVNNNSASYSNVTMGPQNGYNDYLTDSVKLDQDLMSRYADYEDMSDFPELGSALDLYADDATVQDVITNKSMWFEAEDQTVEQVLNEMLDINIRAEESLWEVTRSMCMYGNEFDELMVMDKVGVIRMNHFPAPSMRRIEDMNGILYGFIHDPSMSFRMDTASFMGRLKEKSAGELTPMPSGGMQDLIQVFEPWEMVHFRLRGKSRSDLYGYSSLEAARWAWKRLTMIEDAMVLYKLTRSPQRYAYYVDVGDVPPQQAKGFLNRIKNEFKKTKFIDPNCLTGDTLIPLLDGSHKSIKELANEYAKTKKSFWIYSYDLVRNKVVPGKAVNAVLSGENIPVYRVRLDSGAVIRCTADHPFLMRDGEYKLAADLSKGDSLMPLYLNELRADGYTGFRDVQAKKVKLVHQMVAVVEVAFDGYEDVYDLVVDEYHNFGLTSGVFVHNTGKPNFRYNPMCISLDTRIPLLNGETKQLRDLIDDYDGGIENWVYSIDPVSKKVKPGKIEWAGVTRKNAKVLKVTLDNHKSITCTPDHKFMTRKGIYVEAQNLQAGDSLMPFRRSVSKEGYEYVVDPWNQNDKKWEGLRYTNRMVAEGLGWEIEGQDVHHDNEHKLNNDPSNLIVRTKEDHRSDHAETYSRILTEWNKSDRHREETAQYNRLYNKGQNIIDYNNSEQHTKDNDKRRSAMKAFREKDKEAYSKKLQLKFVSELIDFLKQVVDDEPAITTDELCSRLEQSGDVIQTWRDANTRKIRSVHRHLLLQIIRSFGYENFSEFKRKTINNHKVLMVEELEYTLDTGCITVGEWHNFAVQPGVFIKNSQDEDIFLPVRKGKRSTEIEVLSGPDGQQIDDAQYFLNKIFAALKIPKSYLGADETVGRANLSQLDSRFSRTVMRIQREVKNGYNQIARVDLAAKNIDPDKVEYECHMVIPSGVFELAQMEVQQAKLDLAQRYKDAKFSEYYVWSEILGMADEDIEKVQGQRVKEQGDAGAFDADGVGTMGEVMPTAIDQARDKMDKKAKDKTDRILTEISQNQTKFAKKINEVKALTQELNHATRNQKYYKGRK